MSAFHLTHQFDQDMHDWLQHRLPPEARLTRLPSNDVWAVPKGTTVLLVTNGKLRSLTRTRPAWADELQWMHMWPTGLDGAPDWLFCLPHVTVSRGAAATAIAEYVLAAMLDFEKALPEIRVTSPDGWVSSRPGGLLGRSLGLFGFGEIGRAVADRAIAFGMKVRATRRQSNAPAPAGVEFVSLDELCATSDHLALCAPLTQDTTGIFDEARLAGCRQGMHLINVARGALIRPDALRHALDNRIARASLDVWNEEPPPQGHWVYAHPRLHLTPHTSFRSPTTDARLREILEQNLSAWLSSRPEDLFGRVNSRLRY